MAQLSPHPTDLLGLESTAKNHNVTHLSVNVTHPFPQRVLSDVQEIVSTYLYESETFACVPETRESDCTDVIIEVAMDPREALEPDWTAATAPPTFPPIDCMTEAATAAVTDRATCQMWTRSMDQWP